MVGTDLVMDLRGVGFPLFIVYALTSTSPHLEQRALNSLLFGFISAETTGSASEIVPLGKGKERRIAYKQS